MCTFEAQFWNMALATFVKIGGINNLSDARYCAGMEVNQLGFNIEHEHENYTSSKDFDEIANWVSGVEFVGEVESSTNIAELIAGYNIQAIEIHLKEQLEPAFATGLQVIFRTNDAELIQELTTSETRITYFIFDGDAQAISKTGKVLVTAGFEANGIKDFVASTGVKGLALQGGNEIRPGFKDFDELADILEALDVDEFA